MADILISDLTNGSLVNNEWVGTGVFDKLIAAVNKNIEGQYNSGRITGSDYSNVYLGSMQAVLAQSMEFLLREKQIEAEVGRINAEVGRINAEVGLMGKQSEKLDEEIDLLQTQNSEMQLNGAKDRLAKDGQIAKLAADTLAMGAQKDMYVRQTEGFDEAMLQKLYDSSISSWGLAYSSGSLTELPTFLTNDSITALYNTLYNKGTT